MHTGVEARKAPRRRVLKAGIVAYNQRFQTVRCTVRDLSATGARLRLDTLVTAPDSFLLVIEMDGMEADCTVVWRKAGEIGVKFLSAPRVVSARRTQVVTALTPEKAPTLRRRPDLARP